MYLRNAWYLAAWAHELSAGKILARTLLGEPLALFRREDGSPAALIDRCPHRFAPLSAGTLSHGRIACRYHGLQFDGGGNCVLNPHGGARQGLGVRAFPVVDAHRGTWIWAGDPAAADPALIPPLEYLAEASDTAFSCGQLLSGKGNYEIFSDNILDLSHTDYLHPDTLGGGAVTSTRQKIEEHPSYIEVTWHSSGASPPPILRTLIGTIPEHTDLVQQVRWYAPAVMRLVSKVVASGQPADSGYANVNAHVMTPETQYSTHYFFAATRNFLTHDGELNARLSAARERIFATEDKPMIEQVAARMGTTDFWELKPRLLPIDEAAVRVRRRLRRLIEDEQASAAPRSPRSSNG